MSKYPPAQGAALALGKILGHPWIGVLLTVAVMCGTIVWALQGWLPPSWALLGGMLAVLQLSVTTYWVNSYYGGAVAAIGGALVIGALPRIIHFRRPRDSVILAVGVSILANSRPFEGLIFCLPVCVFLAVSLQRAALSPRQAVGRVLLPAAGVLLLCGSFMTYYNWRGTGHPFLFPYTVNDATYMSTPSFVWQKLKPPRHYLNPQFESFYNGWSRTTWRESRVDSTIHGVHLLARDARLLASYFLWPGLCVAVLAAPWILFDRRTHFLLLQTVVSFLGFLLITWPMRSHYAAALTATVFGLVTQGMRHLRRWRYRDRAVGMGLSAVVLTGIFLCGLNVYWFRVASWADARARGVAELESISGEHLVIVRYSPQHDPNAEWVYDSADIDHSKIVWAREIPDVSLQPLLNYFQNRKVWLIQPDHDPSQLLPCDRRTRPQPRPDTLRPAQPDRSALDCFTTYR